ncbi:hypothetical protein HMPREF0091_11043 [Fannyhessea vaginae DSM 15829]|uniref:Uncharacterized protein n=1 Tax=Fannyhessea vaginae DSM 15829 TaxID=525256 RepID=F1T6E3_9ACTN|nr:hypothetical protein HMPREF0091_11043 [Fannyhessea vaginae DSM 15829]
MHNPSFAFEMVLSDRLQAHLHYELSLSARVILHISLTIQS